MSKLDTACLVAIRDLKAAATYEAIHEQVCIFLKSTTSLEVVTKNLKKLHVQKHVKKDSTGLKTIYSLERFGALRIKGIR
jgi:hypothetical protein